VCDFCLKPSKQLLVYIVAWQVTFWWDADDVHFCSRATS